MKQEVKEKEGELKQERERLLELSRAESELRARLEGEADKTRIVESHMQELKSQLEGSRSKCLELETSKSSLEAELRADQDQLEASLKEVRSELQQEREKSVSAAHKCVEIESKLEADAASALAADTERQQRLEQAQDQYKRDSEAWNAEKISLDDRLRKTMDALTTEGANSAALGGEVKVLREMVAAGEERVASLEASLLRVQDEGDIVRQKLEAELIQLQVGASSSGGLESQLSSANADLKALKAELAEKAVWQRDNLIEMNEKSARYVLVDLRYDLLNFIGY